jgi:hypothetical protein
VDKADPTSGSWLKVRVGDSWGLGCRVCAKAAKRSPVPAGLEVFAKGAVDTAASLQACHLRRHASTKFHKAACKAAKSGARVGVPSALEFRTVLDLVVRHNSAAGKGGIASVGEGAKVRCMIRCLAEASKRLDQLFMKRLRSMALIRDARHGRLSIRFFAVNDQLECRSGLLGYAIGFGSSSEDILAATKHVMEVFSTKYYGFKPAALIPQLLHAIRHTVIVTNPLIRFPTLITLLAPGIAECIEFA